MIEAVLMQAAVLKKTIKIANGLSDLVCFNLSHNGITIQGTDPYKVALISVYIRSDGFAKYRCDREAFVDVDTAHLSSVLKCIKSFNGLSISYDDKAKRLVISQHHGDGHITVHPIKTSGRTYDYLGIDCRRYDACATIRSIELRHAIAEIGTVSLDVGVGIQGDVIKLMTDMGSSVNEVSFASRTRSKSPTTSVKGNFALRYFNHFTKATALSSMVTIKMSNEYPIMLEYAMAGNGSIQFFLTPEIGSSK